MGRAPYNRVPYFRGRAIKSFWADKMSNASKCSCSLFNAEKSREAAAEGRPPGTPQQVAAVLRALLAIALQNLTFRTKPILGLMTAGETTLLGQLVGAAADFIFHIDRHDMRP
jgi:hypothetical protein